MITEMQIELARQLLSTGLLTAFYHSVELVEDKEGKKYPAYKIGAEQFYCGPDDTKQMFGYIRQSGAATKLEEKLEGGCNKMYKVAIPHRIVIFKDQEERNFDSLVQKLLRVSFAHNVGFVSFNTNAFQLGKEESPIGNFAFDATTFYLAIDIQIKMWLSIRMCDEEECITYPNPICS